MKKIKPYGLNGFSEEINRKVEKGYPFLTFPGRADEQGDAVTVTMRFPPDVYRSLKELSRLERRVMDQEVLWLIKQAALRLPAPPVSVPAYEPDNTIGFWERLLQKPDTGVKATIIPFPVRA
jgi:hypothetical protein